VRAGPGETADMDGTRQVEPGVPAVPAPGWWARALRFLAARFTSGAALGLALTVGFAAVAGLGAVFAVILDAVLEHDGISMVDDPTLSYAVHHRSAVVTAVFRAFTWIGDPLPISAIALLGGLALAYAARSRRPLVITAIAAIGVQALVFGIKVLVARPRPVPAYALDTAGGYSFPSGHATSSLVIFGVLAWLLAAQVGRTTARLAVWTLAALLVLGVGSSRVYLGVHHPTDVVAAWMLGTAWLVTVLVSVSTISRIRARVPPETPVPSGGRGVRGSLP
jgi:membrane-associated phospholipid phosphatase